MESVILWKFHQAARAKAIVIALKHGWCLAAKLRNGVSEMGYVRFECHGSAQCLTM